MAYFDSEKNKAIWQKHLASLDEERQRRKENGYKPEKAKAVVADENSVRPGVRVINFEQLVAKEQARSKARKEMARQRQREMQREMKLDQKAL
jgi:hypothetical protein